MVNDMQTLVETALRFAQNINLVILAAVMVVVLATVLRVAKGDAVLVGSITIKLGYLPLVILGFTIAHLCTALLFNLYLLDLIAIPDLDRSLVFESLRRDGPLVFAGMIGQITYADGLFGPMLLMDPFAPATILAHAAAIVAFGAMLRWAGRSWRQRAISGAVSAGLVAANWLIGSSWALHAACLDDPRICSAFVI